MLDEDAKHPFEMTAVEDQEPVETLRSDGADEALGVRVCPGCADRCVDHLDPFAAEDLVEGGAELAVAVMDQEVRPLEQAGEAQVARLLRHPRTRRIGGAAGQVDAPAFQLDEKEDVEATERDRLDREEIARQDACLPAGGGSCASSDLSAAAQA